MGTARVSFDHIHLISEDPEAAAAWYAEMLGGRIAETYETRGAPQIAVAFDGAVILVRGRRPGEAPTRRNDLRHFADYVSHDHWGADHFGFCVDDDFDGFCATLKEKGVSFAVEPYPFTPNRRIAYIEGPDGVTIELVEPRA